MEVGGDGEGMEMEMEGGWIGVVPCDGEGEQKKNRRSRADGIRPKLFPSGLEFTR